MSLYDVSKRHKKGIQLLAPSPYMMSAYDKNTKLAVSSHSRMSMRTEFAVCHMLAIAQSQAVLDLPFLPSAPRVVCIGSRKV